MLFKLNNMLLVLRYDVILYLIILVNYTANCDNNPWKNVNNQSPADQQSGGDWPAVGEKRGSGINKPENLNTPAPQNVWVRTETPRRDYVATPRPTFWQNGNNKGSTSNSDISNSQNSRRDYVNPNVPSNNQQQNNNNRGGNNYNPNGNNNRGNNNGPGGSNAQNSRRDYVNPNINNNKGQQGAIINDNKRDFVANNPGGSNGNPKPVLSYSGAAKQNLPNPSQPAPSIPISTTPELRGLVLSPEDKLKEDNELREFSEALIKKDVNNAAKYVKINYQGRTNSYSKNDLAPKPLLEIGEEAYKIPSISKLMLLHNNYILKSNLEEEYTAAEKIEENNFIEAIISTPVMEATRNFLIKKGKISRDQKDFTSLLKDIWFNMYSRGGGKIGSSGFEHVFIAEIKKNEVSGLHNWLYFNSEENKHNANYLGYMKKLEFDKGAIVKYHFTFHDLDKPVGGMFIGTSPEFELALYSTCFILRADQICPMRLGGKNFGIRTYTYRYKGKEMIGSAFPDI